jgi:hypothetical protein
MAGKEGTCSLAPSGNPGANAACAFPLACDGVNAACPTSCASDAACAAAYYCSADGSCQARKAQASACNAQTDCNEPSCRECTSGFCVDGFCCDKACSGTCEACGAAVKQSGLADGTCDAAKEGLVRGGVLCGPGAICDGDHTTKSADGTTKDCAPYKCDSNGTCQGLCTSVNDCVAPTICDATGKCVAASDTGGDSGGCSVSRSAHAQRCDWSPLALAILGALAAFARRRVAQRSALLPSMATCLPEWARGAFSSRARRAKGRVDHDAETYLAETPQCLAVLAPRPVPQACAS